MRLLAIDTATPRPSLTVVSGSSIPYTVELPRLGAEALAPAVGAALAASGLSPRDLDRIAVVSGPGSFTGLRSSVAFARGLARAVGALLVPVPTFEAASETAPSPADADFVLDALRGEVHRRRRRGGVLEAVEARLGRAEATAEAARDGVSLVDLGTAQLLVAPAAASLAVRAPEGDTGTLRYGRPPAAEERFGPGEGR
ncbi:MAG: tRNA (adenosine(37)-N6)-threonylcarbamoyltransferase complex dimerization subunit type 1 TsaB [Thermoanaerobaculia bacterium]|nr:tRNA (adenosine(37)-N6)-threonylcarbamoyltransferase complex dimerization subunit type 1 TsaB [Thermoanaerobaculia bacterium]